MTGFLYDIIITVVMTLSAVLPVCVLFFPKLITMTLYAVIFAGTAGFLLAKRLKPSGRVLFAGALAVLTAGALVSLKPSERMERVLNDLWMVPAVLTCLLTVLAEPAVRKNRRLFLIPQSLIVAALAVSLFAGIRIGKAVVLILLFCFLLMHLESVQRGWKREGGGSPEMRTLFLLPFLLVLMGSLFLIRMPEAPFDWTFVRNAAEKVHSVYELLIESFELRQSWTEGEAVVGFSDRANFFGNVRTDSYTVMKIDSPVSNGMVYLSGRSFDTFDGRTWTKQDESQEDHRITDLLETSAAVFHSDPDHIYDYLRKSSFEINLEGIRSSHVFSPAKSLPEVRNRTVHNEGGDLYFSNRRVRRYRMEFFLLNWTYDGLSELLHSADPEGEEASLKEAAEWLRSQGIPANADVNALKSYKEEVYRIYCPKTALSEEVMSLLDQRLENTSGSYEKLRQIESFLSSMTYTGQPGELPEEVNSPEAFADYLILDSQRGYCTHFATAFVLLARAQGIPARYIQGYSFMTQIGVTEVRSDHAHSWPEAYVEGIGWIGFEPTPGYKVDSGWKIRSRRETETGTAYQYAVEEEDEEEADEAGQTRQEQQIQNRPGASAKADFPVIPVVLFLLGALLLAVIRKKRYQRMSDAEKIIVQSRRCLRHLKLLGYTVRPGETLTEFGQRAVKGLPEDLLTFLPLYEKVLYSGKDVLPAEVNDAETAARNLLKYWLYRNLKRKKQDAEPEEE